MSRAKSAYNVVAGVSAVLILAGSASVSGCDLNKPAPPHKRHVPDKPDYATEAPPVPAPQPPAGE